MFKETKLRHEQSGLKTVQISKVLQNGGKNLLENCLKRGFDSVDILILT